MEEVQLPIDVLDDDIVNHGKIDKIKWVEEKQSYRSERKIKKIAAIARREERLSNHRPPKNCFVGKHKWLGGAVDPETGTIYGVPSNTIEVICIHPPDVEQNDEPAKTATISTIPLPNKFKEGCFKWLRGIITNGFLYGIPAWSTNGVLKVRLTKKGKGPRVKLLPLPKTPTAPEKPNRNHNEVRRDLWMWHGAGLSQSSKSSAIYCIPSNHEKVLKIDVLTDTLSEIGPAFTEGQNKWYGGIRGRDGCIYGVPYTASGVLRIDPSLDDVQVLGNFPRGGWKWHGGLMAPSNGVIYAFPAHSNRVLCIDTNKHPPNQNQDQNDQQWRISTIPIHKHSLDKDPDTLRYKWLGGAYGADGCIYGMPSDASSILRIDPNYSSNEARATTFGDVTIKSKDTKNSEVTDLNMNKWQGGVLSPKDGCVYAVPANANCVLKIDTNPNTPLDIQFLECQWDGNSSSSTTTQNDSIDRKNINDKWQGGFLGKDGVIYGIPECIDRVMALYPGKHAQVRFIS